MHVLGVLSRTAQLGSTELSELQEAGLPKYPKQQLIDTYPLFWDNGPVLYRYFGGPVG